jgi:glycosyltransferase involved in cell wall biosynthesis
MKSSFPLIILINGKNPLKSTGGYQTYTLTLAKLLKELKFNVQIFCIGNKDQITIYKGIVIQTNRSIFYKIPFLKSMELAALPLFSLTLSKSILANFSKSRHLILWGIGPWTLAGVLVKLFRKVTLFSYYPTTFKHEFTQSLKATNISDHGIINKFKIQIAGRILIPLYDLFERWAVKSADQIIVHYRSAKKILKDQFKAKNIHLIPDYIENFPKIRPSQPQSAICNLQKPVIIFTGRHDPRKGINYLLPAAKILEEKQLQFSLIIIGEGLLFNSHQNLVKKLKLKNVKLTGFVSDAEVYLKKADIFVFPGVEEGSSSISILEATKQGLAIVSTNVDGISEDLENNKSALLVPPHNSNALARALEKVISNKSLVKKLGIEAKNIFVLKHNKNLVKKELTGLLRYLAMTDKTSF